LQLSLPVLSEIYSVFGKCRKIATPLLTKPTTSHWFSNGPLLGGEGKAKGRRNRKKGRDGREIEEAYERKGKAEKKWEGRRKEKGKESVVKKKRREG